MAVLTVRNIPDEVHRALRVRAARHGRSTEAEVREMLENAVKPEGRIKLGSFLDQIGQKLGGVDLSIHRDQTAAEPLSFE